jgi:protein TonB
MTMPHASRQPAAAAGLILASLFSPGAATASDAAAGPAGAATQPPTPCAKPAYPAAAMAARVEGITVVRISVAADGMPQKASIEKPAGATREHRLLDRAAVEHLVRCRLSPPQNGEPATIVVQYVWKHGLPEPAASAP